VYVRLFDQSGKLIDEFPFPHPQRSILDSSFYSGQEVIEFKEGQSAEASKRYIATSSSKGCIQGRSDLDEKTEAPVNVFEMPCNSNRNYEVEIPIDFRLTSDPPAKFTVRWEIPSSSGPTCHWETDLDSGSTVQHFTSDERLIIEATALADPLITGHLELDWDHVPRTKTTIPNPARTVNGGSGVETRRLKSFTIEPLSK
jgi:hypothetical protein